MAWDSPDVEASSDDPVLSVVLAETGDTDGVTSTVGVVLPVGPSDEADPKPFTNRSSHARRQGLARITAVTRGRQAGSVRRLRRSEHERAN